MRWLGRWFGRWFERADPAPPTVVPFDAEIVRLSALFGDIQRANILVADVQEIGAIMIDLFGPIEIERGDTFFWRFTVRDDTGAAIDVTGYEFEVEVKTEIDGPDPAVIAKTVGAGVTILAQTGDTLGQSDVLFTSADNTITSRLYWLDVVAIKSGVRTHVVKPRPYTILGVVNGP